MFPGGPEVGQTRSREYRVTSVGKRRRGAFRSNASRANSLSDSQMLYRLLFSG